MASRLLEDRRTDQALFLGLLTAAAIMTKGQGAVLLLVAVAATAILLARRQLNARLLGLAIGPGVIALSGWSLWTWMRYDTVNSSQAFLDLVGAVEPLGVGQFISELWLNGWSSYWGAYDGGTLRWITGGIILVIVAAGFIGLILRPESWLDSAEGRDRLILSGTLVAGLLAAAWVANDSGLAHPHGRMLIGAFPALTTLTIAGIRRLGGDIAVLQAGIATVTLSSVYFLFWYMPFFY